MLRQKDIIWMSSGDWDSIKGRSQHFILGLSEDNRVLYVNYSAGISRIIDLLLKRGNRRANIKFTPKLEKINENLYVLTPFYWIPSLLKYKAGIQFFNYVNSIILTNLISSIARRLKFINPILILAHPRQASLLGKFGEKLSIYDCADNFPNFQTNKNMRDFYSAMERKILERADIVFVSATNLMEKFKSTNRNVYLVPNGVDIDHFSCNRSDPRIPPDMESIKHPVIGFVGTIAAWVDLDSIGYIAGSHPEWSVVLIGPVVTDVTKLKKYANIFLLGEKDYSVLPDYIKLFDVCLIPFKVNNLTHFVDPVKLYEYSAMGKPAVATNLKSLRDYKSICRLSMNFEDFVKNIQEGLAENSEKDMQRRIEFAQRNTWESRITRIKEIVSEALERKKAKGAV